MSSFYTVCSNNVQLSTRIRHICRHLNFTRWKMRFFIFCAIHLHVRRGNETDTFPLNLTQIYAQNISYTEDNITYIYGFHVRVMCGKELHV